jgi:hypothetical protein
MSEGWDSYFCHVDGKIASIFLDLDIAKEAPLAGLPNMAFIRLYMRKPRTDGLSSQEEFDTLCEIQDALEATLVAPKKCSYVGRTTTDGFRDFVFYIADAQHWQSRVRQALLPFQDYRFESGTRPDPQWSTYRDFLYPSAEAHQQILNRKVRDVLEKNGDTLSAPREVDHWAYFPTPTARAAFLAKFETRGFALRGSPEGPDKDGRYWLQIFHVAAADNSLDDTILDLFRAAQEQDGDYDGWECPVASSAPKPN